MPMPNATVATTTSTRSSRNASWCRLRTWSSRPAWYGAARRAVDDARFAVVAREDVGQLRMQVAAPQHAIGQVRAVERSDEQERLGEPELRGDVAADALGRGGGEPVQRHAWEILAQASE